MPDKTNFSTLTPCGGDCTGCPKKADGICAGCLEMNGYVPEWAESGRCRAFDCNERHGSKFCGVCVEFPCPSLNDMIHWDKDIAEHMRRLAEQYRETLRQ